MYQSWRACVEEYLEAKEAIGVLGALAFVSLLVAITLAGLLFIFIMGTLALIVSPIVLVVALLTMIAPRSDRAEYGMKKQCNLDPWFTE